MSVVRLLHSLQMLRSHSKGDIVKSLFDADDSLLLPEINDRVSSLLVASLIDRSFEVSAMLLSLGIRLCSTAEEWPVVCEVVKLASPEALEWLIDHCAEQQICINLDATDLITGLSAAHYACERDKPEHLAILGCAGADLITPSKGDLYLTPYEIAMDRKFGNCLQVLTEFGIHGSNRSRPVGEE